MEIKELVSEYNRMCHTLDGCCRSCELLNYCDSCFEVLFKFPDEFIEIIERWSKEHPKKTNRDWFKELFPERPWEAFKGKGDCNLEYYCMNTPCAYCKWWEEEYEKK